MSNSQLAQYGVAELPSDQTAQVEGGIVPIVCAFLFGLGFGLVWFSR